MSLRVWVVELYHRWLCRHPGCVRVAGRYQHVRPNRKWVEL